MVDGGPGGGIIEERSRSENHPPSRPSLHATRHPPGYNAENKQITRAAATARTPKQENCLGITYLGMDSVSPGE